MLKTQQQVVKILLSLCFHWTAGNTSFKRCQYSRSYHSHIFNSEILVETELSQLRNTSWANVSEQRGRLEAVAVSHISAGLLSVSVSLLQVSRSCTLSCRTYPERRPQRRASTRRTSVTSYNTSSPWSPIPRTLQVQ